MTTDKTLMTDFYYRGLDTYPPFVPVFRSVLYSDLSAAAKIIYALLFSRAQLSASRDNARIFSDEYNRVFIYYTIEQLSEDSKFGKSTVKKTLKELEEKNLILRIRQGLGKANRIYVLIPYEISEKNTSIENACIEETYVGKSNAGEVNLEEAVIGKPDIGKPVNGFSCYGKIRPQESPKNNFHDGSEPDLPESCFLTGSNNKIKDNDLNNNLAVADNKAEAATAEMEKIVRLWNSIPITRDIEKIRKGTSRYRYTMRQLKEDPDGLINTIRSISDQAFFKKKYDEDDPVTYDWFINPDNYQRIIEGNYAIRRRKDMTLDERIMFD